MGEDSGEVGKRGKLHEAADKGVEGGGGAHVDTGQDGHHGATDEGGIEGVVHRGVDAADLVREWSGSVASKGPESATSSDVAASAVDDGGEEGHNQQSKSTASGATGLVVDLCKGKRALQDSIEVVDGVEERNHIKQSSDEADAHLGKDSLGDVLAGLGDLLREMGRAVRCANGVGTVKHTGNENETIARVPSRVRPGPPNILVRGIRDAVDMGHAGADNNGDENTGQDEEPSQVVQLGEEAVQEQNNRAAQPGADDEADKDMPGLHLKSWVHQRIHGDGLLA